MKTMSLDHMYQPHAEKAREASNLAKKVSAACATIALVGCQSYSAEAYYDGEAEPTAARQTEAQELVASYTEDTIAIVPFGVEVEDAEDIARSVEHDLDEISGGVLSPELVVAMPSDDAVEKYESAGECVDKFDTVRYVIKRDNLYEQGFDKVVAVTDKPLCNGPESGFASLVEPIAEVYAAYDHEPSDEEYSLTSAAAMEHIVPITHEATKAVTGHEIGHLYNRLGHMSAAQPVSGEDSLITYSNGVDSVRDAMSRSVLASYEKNHMMGNSSVDNLPPEYLKPVELAILEEPHRISGAETSISYVEAQPGTPVEISRDTQPDVISFAVPNGTKPVMIATNQMERRDGVIQPVEAEINLEAIQFEVDYFEDDALLAGEVARISIYAKGEGNQLIFLDTYSPIAGTPDESGNISHSFYLDDTTYVLTFNREDVSGTIEAIETTPR